jgi:hypothetical protein
MMQISLRKVDIDSQVLNVGSCEALLYSEVFSAQWEDSFKKTDHFNDLAKVAITAQYAK